MDRAISMLQGVAMVGLLAMMVVAFWAVGPAAVQAQSSCEDDPYCHVGTKGSNLVAFWECSTPNCNSRSQWCCIDF